jgi:hypothetical protein
VTTEGKSVIIIFLILLRLLTFFYHCYSITVNLISFDILGGRPPIMQTVFCFDLLVCVKIVLTVYNCTHHTTFAFFNMLDNTVLKKLSSCQR